MEQQMIGLYNALHGKLASDEGKIMQFIGSSKGEGVTTLVEAFGRTLARKLGKSVLVADPHWYRASPAGDLAPGSLHHLATLGLGSDGVLKVGFQATQEPGVSLCRSSTDSSEPLLASVLTSPDLDKLFDTLRQQFDVVLFDSEPVSRSPEALSLAPRVDGVVLVLSGDDTRWPDARKTTDRLLKTGAEVLGILFNKQRPYLPESLDRLFT